MTAFADESRGLRPFVAPGELAAGENCAGHRGDEAREIGGRIEMERLGQREHLEDVAMGTVARDRPRTVIAQAPEPSAAEADRASRSSLERPLRYTAGLGVEAVGDQMADRAGEGRVGILDDDRKLLRASR